MSPTRSAAKTPTATINKAAISHVSFLCKSNWGAGRDAQRAEGVEGQDRGHAQAEGRAGRAAAPVRADARGLKITVGFMDRIGPRKDTARPTGDGR